MSPLRTSFPDPASLDKIPVYDLLQAAARGHIGIDQRFMRAILAHGESAVPDLLRFGMEDHTEDRVDLEEDLIALLRSLNAERGLEFYLECIRREPRDVPDDLVNAILPFGERAVDPLLKLCAELDEEDTGDIAFLLASLGVRDPRILELLLDRLEFDAGDGAFCLGLYGDPTARPALEKVLSEVSAEDQELRREIVFTLEQLDAPTPDSRGPVETEAPDLNDMYPDEAPPPFEVLDDEEILEMLESESAANRAAAAESFRNRDVTPGSHSKLFARAQSDPDPKVRANCWEALADSEDKAVRSAMKTVVADASADVVERCGALVGLCNATEDPPVVKRIREFYADPETRAKAMEAMWRSFDRQFADYFPKHLDDADEDIRRQAIWGVGYLGIGSEAARLAKLFEDDDLRSDALFAYALCVPAEISRGRIMGLYRKVDKAAGGLSMAESELVKIALDQRLVMHRLEPVFSEEAADDGEFAGESAPQAPPQSAPGRNDPCPCGSGKKYKKCHGA